MNEHHDHGPASADHSNMHHDHAAPMGATDLAACPVMPGNLVSRADAEAHGRVREHDGQTYYLCCDDCVAKWDADPAKWAAAATAAGQDDASAHSHEGHDGHDHAKPSGMRHDMHAGHTMDMDMPAGADHSGHDTMAMSPQDMMGHGGHHGGMSMASMTRDMRNRFLVALILSIPIVLWSPIGREVLHFTVPAPFGLRDDVFSLILSLPVIFYSSWIFFDGAWRALRRRTLDMMVLVAVGIGAGWIYSVVVTLTGGGDVFYEAASVLATFVLLGHWVEMRARGGANDAIRRLLELSPERAVVLRDGNEVEIPTSEVLVGDVMLVRPGAKVPTDGEVIDGESEIDESMVTGESMPVAKSTGTTVIGATLNTTGSLRVKATKIGADTALAQIIKLVQTAQMSKAPGQRLADRAAFWLVLVALIGGAATFLGWWLSGAPLPTAILFAITVVVITCPDALGLATPTAIMVGTSLGAKRGVLFKSAGAIETAAHIDTVVFDKTGTLTLGQPEVTDVIATSDETELLALVAAVERESEHPLARAIVAYAEAKQVRVLRATGFQNVTGQGATALVDGKTIEVGSPRLFTGRSLGDLGTRLEALAATGRTAIVVAIDGTPSGVIALADAPRPTSAAAIAALHEAGVRSVMLTGDNRPTAERIAGLLGIDTVIAEVLPEDKSTRIADLQREGRKVAMVGDGVNDAPALAQADLGIAIGAGTDVAIETADVVLMRSDPLDVPVALRIGQGTLRKMRQNLGWAVGYNAIALPIAAGAFAGLGFTLSPEIAAISMSGSSVIVAVNALLLRWLRLPAPTATSKPNSDTIAAPTAAHPGTH